METRERYEVATTKQIKAALEEAFRWRGFSVTKSRGTASRWVRVAWTNGPTSEAVDKVVSRFNDTKHDDITTDLWVGSQYTNTSRRVEPDGAWLLLSTFDLRQRMPALWELVQEAGRLACRHNDAQGWGAGENWLELVKIDRPWEINRLLDGFRALGYKVAQSAIAGGTRYTFDPMQHASPKDQSEAEAQRMTGQFDAPQFSQ